jgi:hypothetical protein
MIDVKNKIKWIFWFLSLGCSVPGASEEGDAKNFTSSTKTRSQGNGTSLELKGDSSNQGISLVEGQNRLQIDSFLFGNLRASDLKRTVIEKNGSPDSTERIDLALVDNVISEWYYYNSYSILFENANDPESTILIIESHSKNLSFSSGLPKIGSHVSLLRPFFSTLEFEDLVSKKVGRIAFYDGLQGLDTWLVIEVDSNLIKSVKFNNTSF